MTKKQPESSNTIDADLPSGWTRVAIAEIAAIHSGQSPKGIKYAIQPEGDVPWFKIADMNQDGNERFMRVGNSFLSHDDVEWLGMRIFPAKTLIFPKRGGAIATNKKRLLGKPACLDLNLMALVMPDELVSFVWWWFQTIDLARLSDGTNVPQINNRHIVPLKVPIAPLTEQKRIVAKIEELFSDLDAGVSALERARANLRRYRASVLKSAIEGRLTQKWRSANPGVEPASELLARILRERRQRWEKQQLATYESKGNKPPKNWQSKYKEPAAPATDNLPALPTGWCWAALEQLSPFDQEIAYGVLQPGKQFDGGTELVRVGDIKNGTIDNTTLKEIDPKIAEKYQRTVLRGGEVLLTIVGAIGRSAVVPNSLAGANVARAVAVIPLEPSLSAEYLRLTLATNSMRNRLTKRAHEVARKTLNLEDVRRVVVPIAPLAEQEEIVCEMQTQFASIEKSEKTVLSNIEKQNTTRQSILSRAFKGELVQQDPNDEPVRQMLERIAVQRELEKKRPKPSRPKGTKMSNEIRPILEVLSENPDGITPERLYAIAGFENADLEDDQNPIDVFYAALKKVQRQIVEEKPDRGEAFRWPVSAKISLKATQ